MDADGSDETRITNAPGAADRRPAFSPDGTKIVFNSDRDSAPGVFDIFVMDAGGGAPANLTPASAATDIEPDWGVAPPVTPEDCTVTGSGYIVGTPGNDVICGSEHSDMVLGRGGDDVVFARGGSDVVLGNGGDDVINGGTGSDTLRGGHGLDVLAGGSGHDALSGGPGDDQLSGGPGYDALSGGRGQDALDGGPQFDACLPGLGADPAPVNCP